MRSSLPAALALICSLQPTNAQDAGAKPGNILDLFENVVVRYGPYEYDDGTGMIGYIVGEISGEMVLFQPCDGDQFPVLRSKLKPSDSDCKFQPPLTPAVVGITKLYGVNVTVAPNVESGLDNGYSAQLLRAFEELTDMAQGQVTLQETQRISIPCSELPIHVLAAFAEATGAEYEVSAGAIYSIGELNAVKKTDETGIMYLMGNIDCETVVGESAMFIPDPEDRSNLILISRPENGSRPGRSRENLFE